jgi:hypothetical protein
VTTSEFPSLKELRTMNATYAHQRGAHSITRIPTETQTELAYRSSAGVDVTLVWVRRGEVDEALVCVRDRAEGAYFEIPAEPYLALDVYYHPFAYRDFSTVDYEDTRLAA